MRVDFFRFEGDDGSLVVQTLQRIQRLRDDDSRARDLSGVPFRFQSLHHGDRFWEGDVVRIRMHDVPTRVNRAGRAREVELETDEGIGEDTAFLFDPLTSVLAIQANRFGIAASKWARLIEVFLGQHENALIPAVIAEEIDRRIIDRLDVVRKITVRYAGESNARTAVGPSADTAKTVRQIAVTAPVFEYTVSMGRKQGTLPIREARALLREAFRAARTALTGEAGKADEPENILVVGTFDDDTKADLDLLQYLVRETVEVAVDQATRRMVYGDRRTGVMEAFSKRRADLERRFVRRKRT